MIQNDSINKRLLQIFYYRACSSMMIIYESQTGNIVNCVPVHKYIIECMAFSSDFQYFASAETRGNLRVFKWPDLSIFFTVDCKEIVNVRIKGNCDKRNKRDCDKSCRGNVPVRDEASSIIVRIAPARTFVERLYDISK